MNVPGISQTLRCYQGNLWKTLYFDCKTHENINKWCYFLFFGKWPRYKRDNALLGVYKQVLMDFMEATVLRPPCCPLKPVYGHLVRHYPLRTSAIVNSVCVHYGIKVSINTKSVWWVIPENICMYFINELLLHNDINDIVISFSLQLTTLQLSPNKFSEFLHRQNTIHNTFWITFFFIFL